MIFDVILQDNIATFTCALVDYDEEPTYTKAFMLTDGKLDSGPWQCLDPHRQPGAVPAWALRLAKVLEPRVMAMLLTGRPHDLRRWIDDELIDTIANELEVPNDEPVI